jgi:hypothetical protein
MADERIRNADLAGWLSRLDRSPHGAKPRNAENPFDVNLGRTVAGRQERKGLLRPAGLFNNKQANV